MYSNGAIQNGLYSGTSLQPLSEVGFFSKRTGALNKDNVPVRAIITMVCICLALAVVLLVIPETIEGFDLQGKMTGDRTQDIIIISEYVPPFSVASLSQVTSIYAIITYISVVFTVLYCILKEKSIKSNIYLNVAFFICLFFLAVFAVCHLFFEIYDVIASRGQMSFVIKIVSELTVLIATYGFFAANYYVKCKQISNNY
jgi:amino acid transporter